MLLCLAMLLPNLGAKASHFGKLAYLAQSSGNYQNVYSVKAGNTLIENGSFKVKSDSLKCLDYINQIYSGKIAYSAINDLSRF